MVNMIFATHIPKQKREPRDVYAMEPVAPKLNTWSSCPITFDRRDHPTSIRHGGSTALVHDPIIDGFHLTRVLMDGGSSLNLLYQDTVCKIGVDPSRIKPTKTTFKGVIPGVEACCIGSITLKVVFGSPDSYRTEELVFDIVPFHSDYQALLGRNTFARFNAVPHYAYCKLKMPGPRGVIMVNGRSKLPLTALTARATNGTSQSNLKSMAKLTDSVEEVRATAWRDRPAHPELN